jgi:hypothetical protein
MVFNATFSNILVISWRSVLLVEETGVPGEYHRPVSSKKLVYPEKITDQSQSPGTPVSSTNKTDRHEMTKILLKVALNTITLTLIT